MAEKSALPTTGDRLTDTCGRVYTLGKSIGRGGQGIVYREANDQLAIKLYTGQNPGAAKEYIRRFTELTKRSDLPHSLVKPIAVLTPPYTGYVMKRVKGHEPLAQLTRFPSPDELPAWYNSLTGGLRRRLVVGARIARAFAEIHLSGLAYCDLSMDNILVAKDVNYNSICLIDCDNLSVSGKAAFLALGTPWFMAPELLRGGHLPDAITDNHSLAVILFYLLTLNHPLIGDVVQKSDPDTETAAMRGEYPYIEHPTDYTNRSSTGLPRPMVLSPRLLRLFEKAFVDGLENRLKRPTPGDWEEAFMVASYMTIECPACGFTKYYSRVVTTCPWCNEEFSVPPVMEFKTMITYEGLVKRHEGMSIGGISLGRDINIIPARFTRPGAAGQGIDEPVAILHRVKGQNNRISYALENTRDEYIEVVAKKDNKINRLAKGRIIGLETGETIVIFGKYIHTSATGQSNTYVDIPDGPVIQRVGILHL